MWGIWLSGLILLESLADIFAKEYSLKKSAFFFVISLLCYLLANTCWLVSMSLKSHLGLGANIFSVSSGILAALIGCFMYEEVLTTTHIIGIGLGFVSLVLLTT